MKSQKWQSDENQYKNREKLGEQNKQRGENEQTYQEKKRNQYEQIILNNQARCCRLLSKKITEKTASLSVELIKEVHGILMDGVMTEEMAILGEPGQFRGNECESPVAGTDAGDIEKELHEPFANFMKWQHSKMKSLVV